MTAEGGMSRVRWAVQDQLSSEGGGRRDSFVVVRKTRSCRRNRAGDGVLCREFGFGNGDAAADGCGERGP
jgi:hypothetical protein